MVIESLVDPVRSHNKLIKMFLLGILYSSVAIVLSLWVFKSEASIIMVSLTVFASIPLVYKAIKVEEKKDKYIADEGLLLEEHAKALSLFIALFLGFVVSFSMWYIFLPDYVVSGYLFSSQLETIKSINSEVTGHVIGTSILTQIFLNNFKVLMFCVLFSFFYGSGAIFILTWNASVISSAVGIFVKSGISKYAAEVGWMNVAAYFHIISLGLLRYLTHGIFEILAFFIGGLAGGIISVAVIRHEVFSDKFKRIIFDSFYLVVLAVFVLLIAALVEVYITPAMF